MTTPTRSASPPSETVSPRCTAPNGYRLAYVVTHEAWYSQPPLTRPPGDRNVLAVSMDNLGGGCAWEFSIDDEVGGGLRVKVYDDGWKAFVDVPEFFTAVAALGRGALLSEVIEILDSLGFTDTTKRLPDDPATRARFHAAQQTAEVPDEAPEECEAWACDGQGWSHQGTSYKSGAPEKQYAPCGRRCGRGSESDSGTP